MREEAYKRQQSLYLTTMADIDLYTRCGSLPLTLTCDHTA